MTTTVSGTFTAVDSVSATLSLGVQSENVTLTISNTFVATWALERATSPAGLSWDKVATGTAGKVVVFKTNANDRLRVRCTAFTSGTITYSLVDEEAVVHRLVDANGVALATFTQAGVLFAGTLGVVALTTVGNQTVLFNQTVSGYARRASIDTALTAVGTDRATALQLAAQSNHIGTAAASTGVVLPVGVIGDDIEIFHDGANAIQVYASASETIDTIAGATGVVLTNAKRCRYKFIAANTWVSAQLGVVSA